MIPGSARNWIAVHAVQKSSLNKNENENDKYSRNEFRAAFTNLRKLFRELRFADSVEDQ